MLCIDTRSVLTVSIYRSLVNIHLHNPYISPMNVALFSFSLMIENFQLLNKRRLSNIAKKGVILSTNSEYTSISASEHHTIYWHFIRILQTWSQNTLWFKAFPGSHARLGEHSYCLLQFYLDIYLATSNSITKICLHTLEYQIRTLTICISV